ncbi:hypothetical protein [Candidatus Phytoplasma melaleucae]|uniref:Uncharacterized protein n=1 Tax=Candidatus Phytoplasma melaleucae TaxID=2982630 RepID=A0ABT9DDN0_9MOLU|nr:hypothetical protein ['Melaleuca sp.' phytoplasma]MDO8167978.1 hypothetical protein ['Melaleuca sp.' phytoplasma]
MINLLIHLENNENKNIKKFFQEVNKELQWSLISLQKSVHKVLKHNYINVKNE